MVIANAELTQVFYHLSHSLPLRLDGNTHPFPNLSLHTYLSSLRRVGDRS
jgi:hypothetical protein